MGRTKTSAIVPATAVTADNAYSGGINNGSAQTSSAETHSGGGEALSGPQLAMPVAAAVAEVAATIKPRVSLTPKSKRRNMGRSRNRNSGLAATPSSMIRREPGFDTDSEDNTPLAYTVAAASTTGAVGAARDDNVEGWDSTQAATTDAMEQEYTGNNDGAGLSDGDTGSASGHDEQDSDDDQETDEEPSIRNVQEAINISHPFGLKIWKPALYPKSRSIDFKSYEALHSVPGSVSSRFLYLSPDNLAWTLLFGWWIALLYMVIAIAILGPMCLFGYLGYGLCRLVGYSSPTASSSHRHTPNSSVLSWIPRMFLEFIHLKDYALILINLAGYMFWPFGKFIAKRKGYHMIFQQVVDTPASPSRSPNVGTTVTPEYVGIEIGGPTHEQASSGHGARVIHTDGSYYIDEHHEGGEVQDLLTEFSLGVGRHDRYSWPSWVPNAVRRTWNAGLSGFIFYIVALVILTPIHLAVSSICFFLIFPVPMARLNYVLLRHLLRHPLQLSSHYASEYRPSQGDAFEETGRPVADHSQDADADADAVLQANTAANSLSTGNTLANAASSSSDTPLQETLPAAHKNIRGQSKARPKSIFFWRPESTTDTDQSTSLGNSPMTHTLESEPPIINPPSLNHTADVPASSRTQRFYLPASGSLFFPISSAIPLLDSEYEIVLCTYHAMGFAYYKYTVDGTNIIFINLLSMVAFTLFDFYVIGPSNGYTGIAGHGPIFIFALLSVVPLAYFIGMAVSSITAHTGSVAIGSVINATFGSIIEIILYGIALMEGKNQLVEGSIIGSFLAGLLALPGVAMFFGGLVRKEQRFNAKSAGVTSTMMVVAVIGVFTPTLFQTIYGSVQINCSDCHIKSAKAAQAMLHASSDPTDSNCRRCSITKVPPSKDHVYITSTQPLMYFCAVILVLAYAVGLWFSLGTHASKIYPKKKPKSKARMIIPDGVANLFTRRTSDIGIGSPRPLSLGPSQMPMEHSALTPTANISADTSSGLPNRMMAPSTLLQSQNSEQLNLVISPALRARLSRRNQSDSNFLSPTMRPHSVAGATAATPSLPFSPRQYPGSPRDHLGAKHRAVEKPHHSLRDDISSARSDSDDEGSEGGHDNPGWSLFKSALVLLGCTVLYSVIAEVLIDSIDFVLETFPMDEKTLGLTIFAIVPTITEFYNAIAFAMNGNIVLSLEIGSAYAIQVALLQIPSLVAFSAFWQIYGTPHSSTAAPLSLMTSSGGASFASASPADSLVSAGPKLPFRYVGKAFTALFRLFSQIHLAAMGEPTLDTENIAMMSHSSDRTSFKKNYGVVEEDTFTLIFPSWDFYSVMFAVFLLTYIYIEGKSNYFKGAILLLSYTMLMAAFFFVPKGMDEMLMVI
ncbi:calcium/proton exchanger [Batrachochytrium salamandrivorans]|nr:calcium/proton exchanger [Batrachochytrium salamandrivorans]